MRKVSLFRHMFECKLFLSLSGSAGQKKVYSYTFLIDRAMGGSAAKPKKLANREPHFCYFFEKQFLQILSKRVDPKMGLATCKKCGISQSFTRGMLRFFRFSVNFFLSRTAPSRRQLKSEVSIFIFSHRKKATK